jgi:26S proteasome regulatory subunit T6
VKDLREEIRELQEPAGEVGEVVKPLSKDRILVKIGNEGKYIVALDKAIKVEDLKTNMRVALKSNTYKLYKILPTKVDPLVSLMKVEKVPDSTYDMVGGLDKQIEEVKDVIELPIKHPELYEATGISQPKGSTALLARVRRCLPELWLTTQTARSSECLEASWCRSTSAKAPDWCESCS